MGVTQIIARSHLSSIVEKAETARRSVAVIPFENLDDLSTTSDAARSITDAFRRGLGQTKTIQEVHVPSALLASTDPASWEHWRKIGETTGARMVFGGAVRQRNGKWCVSIHVIESATGSVVQTWVQEAEKPSGIVTDALVKIAELLRSTKAAPLTTVRSPNISEQDLNAVGETQSSLARSYFDRGEQFLARYNLPDLDRAIESFRKSVEIDPSFAIAYAMLATACQARAQVEPTGQWLAEAQAAATTALKIAPALPEAHRAQGSVLRRLNRLRDSVDSFLTAYELDPTTGRTAVLLGDIHQQIGRPDLAIRWFEKARLRLSQPTFADNMGHAWTGLGQYDEAEKAYRAATVFKPDMPAGLLGLSLVALYRGDPDTARKECDRAREKFSQNPEPLEMAALIEFFSRNFPAAEKLYREALASNRKGGVDQAGSVRYLSALGMIEQSSEANRSSGSALLEEARTLDDQELRSAPDNLRRLYSLAANYAALGQKEQALLCLERAIAAGWIDYRALMLDPRFDSLRPLDTFKNSLNYLTNKVDKMRRQLPSRELAFNLK
jgi:tetratricopeptide (TPR) repeat protein